MTLEDKTKAIAKNAEGHPEAAAGAISGDEQMQTKVRPRSRGIP